MIFPRLCILAVAAGVAFGVTSEFMRILDTAANAQEMKSQHDMEDPGHWYPAGCCSLRDCAPIPRNQIEVTPEGYVYHSKDGTWTELIPYDKTRVTPSMDFLQEFHGCWRDGIVAKGNLIGLNWGPRSTGQWCFWAPAPNG